MRGRVFLGFIAPSLVLMIIFIALPLVSVAWQSFHATQGVFEDVLVESCTPGFLTQTCVKEMQSRPVMQAGVAVTSTRFVGWDNYRQLLQPDAVADAFSPTGHGMSAVLNIDFYNALRFTLSFTLITLPFIVGLGLLLALAVDDIAHGLRGPVIFVTLLPYIITPVIGALAIRWLFVGDGVLTDAIRWITGHDVSMFAQGWTIELMMLFYRIWHIAPFAFVVFYAGLQTVNKDTIEASVIDGATRMERLRYVIIPHLMPLIVFVTMIHLMDSYRVFDEVVGFAAHAYRISLQWLTYSFLTPDQTGNRAVARASASAMLTMLGIVVLLLVPLRRTWRDHRGKS